ncbi:MAG: ABC transporter substrate-binding protein [Paracoccus sp. (in: a-proteobacteria)]
MIFRSGILGFSGLLTSLCGVAMAEDLRFMHFWSAPGELRAVEEIRKSAARAGLKLVDVTIEGDFNDLRSALMAALMGNDPPDAAQWIVGDELGKLIDSGYLLPVEDERMDFASVLVPEIYEAARLGHGLSNLPLGIHIENFIVFNRQAFDRIGRPVPRSWPELLEDAPALHQAGIVPLVMSSQAWQMQNLFPNILSSLLSAEEFQHYLTDELPPEDLRPQIEETFRIIAGLRSFAPTPLPDIAFTEGARMVSTGEAAAYALGDYVVPELLDGAPVVCAVSPGTDAILLGVDGMVFVNRDNPEKQRLSKDFVYDFYMHGGASEYVARKGGVSVLALDHQQPADDTCRGQSRRGWDNTANRYWLNGDSWQNHLRIVGKFTTDFAMSATMSPAEATDELLRLMRNM